MKDAGAQFQFITQATGTQTYTCNGSSWSTGSTPKAVLSEDGEAIIDHFRGPTWQDQKDKSAVHHVGKPDVAEPHDGTIPWLLLSTSPALDTKVDDGRNLSQITFIVRMHTARGVPTHSCTYPHDEAFSYNADYVFYAAS